MIALLLLGCVDPGAGHLAGTTITEAWIDDASWGSFSSMLGVISGGGRLRARTVDGEIVGQDVSWSGLVAGLGVTVAGGLNGRVNLTLPESAVPGECLFGDYEGSLEAFAMGAGYHEIRLRNADRVEMDDGGVAIFAAVGVFFLSVNLHVNEHVKAEYLPKYSDDDGDSGWDSGGDTAAETGDNWGGDSDADSGHDSADAE